MRNGRGLARRARAITSCAAAGRNYNGRDACRGAAAGAQARQRQPEGTRAAEEEPCVPTPRPAVENSFPNRGSTVEKPGHTVDNGRFIVD